MIWLHCMHALQQLCCVWMALACPSVVAAFSSRDSKTLRAVAEEARSQQVASLGGLEYGDRVGALEEVFESEVRPGRGIRRVQRLQNHRVLDHRRRRRRFRFDGLLCGSLIMILGADP